MKVYSVTSQVTSKKQINNTTEVLTEQTGHKKLQKQK
jgi:hypothetical protein